MRRGPEKRPASKLMSQVGGRVNPELRRRPPTYAQGDFEAFLKDPDAMMQATFREWDQYPHRQWKREEAMCFWNSLRKDPRFLDYHGSCSDPKTAPSSREILEGLIWGVMEEYAGAPDPRAHLAHVKAHQKNP